MLKFSKKRRGSVLLQDNHLALMDGFGDAGSNGRWADTLAVDRRGEILRIALSDVPSIPTRDPRLPRG